MSHNYYDTFITIAEDSSATVGTAPASRSGKPTIAMMQYEMLSDNFAYTQEDVLFEVWCRRQAEQGKLDLDGLTDDELAEIREQFFAKGQPCLRASALTKTYGWGVIFDSAGRAALCAVDSEEYQTYAKDPNIKVIKAMRSKRA